MRCNRGTCKGPMDLKGYGRDKYWSCVICGHLIYENKASQLQLEQGRELWKNISAVES